MARKNISKDTSGVIFDTHSKMVMSQGGTFERMKEKINAVRAVVPNKSNNEIALVLQHFENCVDRAAQAFVDGSAVEILKEWNVTGKKKPKKKKKPKPQAKEAEPEAEPTPSESTLLPEAPVTHNGFHANGSLAAEGESLDSLSEQLDSVSLDAELDSEPATPDLPDLAVPEAEQHSVSPGPHHQGSRSNKSRPRPGSSSSSSFLPNDQSGASTKKIAPNIDRSVKDLQRCTASLTRYRVLVKDEMDSSIKRMKQTFAELQSCLMDREVALLAEMDKVKAEAMAILDGRQKRAEELRRLTDQSASMSEHQLSELRADIKHFVSERKYDEDLGKAVKFTYELEPLKANITSFGEVYHPQTGYSSRSRCSSSSSSLIGPVAATPSVGAAPAPAPAPAPASAPTPQAPPYGGRPNQPHRQVYQGNRRGGQRFNGSYHDRNPGRGGYRYQGDRYQGDRYHGDRHHGDSSNSAHNRGPAYSSSSYSRHDGSAHNGLPQRPPRTHCP